MSYVKITNGTVDTYPYSVGQLRRDNPNVSFPKQIPTEMLQSYGVEPVALEDQPSFIKRTQNLSQNAAPYLSDGIWKLGWTVEDKTAEEIAEYDALMSEENRDKRNQLLGETDYLALSDNTLSEEMATYRQALRDITAHADWPNLNDADWPVKPV